MKKVKVSEQTFKEIQMLGHGVPRTESRYIQTGFAVGKDYELVCGEETIKVRCTQNCPVHLKVIEDE